jgi:threonine/homoserine/homoserine lactone efflux protein
MTAALPAFALASTLLILAPGPDSVLVLRNTLRHGRRAGWVTATGTMSGLLAWAVAAAFGLSALLQVSHLAYDAVRLAGACYLLWLGVSSLWPARRPHAGPLAGPAAGPAGPDRPAAGASGWRRVYLNGLLSNLLNPKIGVFFIAFLPGFIPAGAPAPLFPLALGLWFIAETGAWLVTLAWMAARGAGWLRRSAVQRWLERVTGVALIGFALRLAAQAR